MMSLFKSLILVMGFGLIVLSIGMLVDSNTRDALTGNQDGGRNKESISTTVETLQGVRVRSCQQDHCFEVRGRSASRSLVRDEYVLEDVELTIGNRGLGLPRNIESHRIGPRRTYRALSARTSSDWRLWLLTTAKGTILFDADSGRVEE